MKLEVAVPEPFKDYLRRQLRASRLGTQLALAAATGIDYGQLNRIFTGKTQRPEIETLEKLATALERPIAEVMRAAGYPTPRPDPVPARQLVLLSLAEDEEYDSEEIVAYVEARPGRHFQEELRSARAERPREDYVEFCLDIFRAWESNSNLGVKALRRGRRRTGTDG